MHPKETKIEAVRLRVQEHLGLDSIADRTGVAASTLSRWLKNHPLDPSEVWDRMRINGRASTGRLRKNRGIESPLHQTVRARNLNSVQVAKVAEAAVMVRMLAQGFNVFGSVFDGDRTDWLVEVPATGKVWKIQVKTASRSDGKGHGLPNVEIRHGASSKRGGQRYEKGDFDFIVGFNLFTDTAYVWAWDEIEHLKTTVSVCPEAAERWDKLLTNGD